MNSEQRKEYNKKYYAEKKVIILGGMLKQEQCEFCNRYVAHQNMFKHQLSGICKRKRTATATIMAGIKETYKNLDIDDDVIEKIIDKIVNHK